jgi:hypothetical protein
VRDQLVENGIEARQAVEPDLAVDIAVFAEVLAVDYGYAFGPTLVVFFGFVFDDGRIERVDQIAVYGAAQDQITL